MAETSNENARMRKFYDLLGSKYGMKGLPDYEKFSGDMQDSAKRQKVYDAMKKKGIRVPDSIDKFSELLGVSSAPQVQSPTPQTGIEDIGKPQVYPTAMAQPSQQDESAMPMPDNAVQNPQAPTNVAMPQQPQTAQVQDEPRGQGLIFNRPEESQQGYTPYTERMEQQTAPINEMMQKTANSQELANAKVDEMAIRRKQFDDNANLLNESVAQLDAETKEFEQKKAEYDSKYPEGWKPKTRAEQIQQQQDAEVLNAQANLLNAKRDAITENASALSNEEGELNKYYSDVANSSTYRSQMLEGNVSDMLNDVRAEIKARDVKAPLAIRFGAALGALIAGDDSQLKREKELAEYSVAERILNRTQQKIDQHYSERADEAEGTTGFKNFVKNNNVSQYLRNYWNGTADEIKNGAGFDFGIYDAREMKFLFDAVKKSDKIDEIAAKKASGKTLTEEERAIFNNGLSDTERAMLDAAAMEVASEALYKTGMGYTCGQVGVQMIPFALEIAINPLAKVGVSAGSGVVRYALKKWGVKSAKHGMLRTGAATARILTDLTVGGVGQAVTTGAGNTYADYNRRKMGQIHEGMDDFGNIVFGGHDEGMSSGKAAATAIASQSLEYSTENFSEWMKGGGSLMSGVANALANNKHTGKAVKPIMNMFAKAHSNEVGQLIKQYRNVGHIGNVFEEYTEEVVNNIGNGIIDAIAEGKDNFTTAEGGVFNVHDNLETFLSVTMPQVFQEIIGIGASGIHSAVQRHRYNQQYKQTIQNNINLFGADRWSAVRDILDNSTFEELSQNAVSLIDGDEFSTEEKQAIVAYAHDLQAKRAEDIAETKLKEYQYDTDPDYQALDKRSNPEEGTVTPAVTTDGDEVFIKGSDEQSGTAVVYNPATGETEMIPTDQIAEQGETTDINDEADRIEQAHEIAQNLELNTSVNLGGTIFTIVDKVPETGMPIAEIVTLDGSVETRPMNAEEVLAMSEQLDANEQEAMENESLTPMQKIQKAVQNNDGELLNTAMGDMANAIESVEDENSLNQLEAQIKSLGEDLAKQFEPIFEQKRVSLQSAKDDANAEETSQADEAKQKEEASTKRLGEIRNLVDSIIDEADLDEIDRTSNLSDNDQSIAKNIIEKKRRELKEQATAERTMLANKTYSQPFKSDRYEYGEDAYAEMTELENQYKDKLLEISEIEDETEKEKAATELDKELPIGVETKFDNNGFVRITPVEPAYYDEYSLHDTYRMFKVGDEIEIKDDRYDAGTNVSKVTAVDSEGKVVSAENILEGAKGEPTVVDGEIVNGENNANEDKPLTQTERIANINKNGIISEQPTDAQEAAAWAVLSLGFKKRLNSENVKKELGEGVYKDLGNHKSWFVSRKSKLSIEGLAEEAHENLSANGLGDVYDTNDIRNYIIEFLSSGSRESALEYLENKAGKNADNLYNDAEYAAYLEAQDKAEREQYNQLMDEILESELKDLSDEEINDIFAEILEQQINENEQENGKSNELSSEQTEDNEQSGVSEGSTEVGESEHIRDTNGGSAETELSGDESTGEEGSAEGGNEGIPQVPDVEGTKPSKYAEVDVEDGAFRRVERRSRNSVYEIYEKEGIFTLIDDKQLHEALFLSPNTSGIKDACDIVGTFSKDKVVKVTPGAFENQNGRLVITRKAKVEFKAKEESKVDSASKPTKLSANATRKEAEVYYNSMYGEGSDKAKKALRVWDLTHKNKPTAKKADNGLMNKSEVVESQDELTDEEKAELQMLGIQLGQDFVESGDVKIADFFNTMVLNFGDGIRPFVKSIYMGISANVADEIADEMDDRKTVRAFDTNTPVVEDEEETNEEENEGSNVQESEGDNASGDEIGGDTTDTDNGDSGNGSGTDTETGGGNDVSGNDTGTQGEGSTGTSGGSSKGGSGNSGSVRGSGNRGSRGGKSNGGKRVRVGNKGSNVSDEGAGSARELTDEEKAKQAEEEAYNKAKEEYAKETDINVLKSIREGFKKSLKAVEDFLQKADIQGKYRAVTERIKELLKEQPKAKVDIAQEKVPYTPVSDPEGIHAIGSVVPSGAMGYLNDAIVKLEEKEGKGVDEFVREELGYDSLEDMYSDYANGKETGLASEQVDSVGLAIEAMKEKRCFIIGDMTGVGKGRQAASLIRWGVRNKKKVIFVTEKPDLFTSMYEDLKDIGTNNLTPFIVNNDANANITENVEGAFVEVEVEGEDGEITIEKQPKKKVVVRHPAKKIQDELYNSDSDELPSINGKGDKKYDFVMMTYSQTASSSASAKKKLEWLKNYAKDAIIVMDESHNASGESNTGQFFQDVVQNSEGVTFLSATYAKKPENMMLYALRSSMSQINMTKEELLNAISEYGIPMQEILAGALFQSGEMVRRERDFSDVKTHWMTPSEMYTEKEIDQLQKTSDMTSGLLRDMISFQRDNLDPIIETLNKEFEAQNQQAVLTHSPIRKARYNPYSGQVSNVFNMMMYGMKSRKTAEMAIQQIKDGKKPVIAVENTLGAYIDALPDGEVEGADFAQVFDRGLANLTKYSVNTYIWDPNKNNGKGGYTISDRVEHDAAKEDGVLTDIIERKIEEYKNDENRTPLSLSPIDQIKQMIADAGFKCGEITGRGNALQFNDNGTVTKVPRKTDKKNEMTMFNNGGTDAIILNVAGATGISLHASKRFKDQKPRTMLILQPARNVNTEVQMRGRIDRTGQVHRGEYFYVTSPVPAEQKLIMMLKQKLASLDANSVGTEDVSSNKVDSQDMDNKYGDEVAKQFLIENPNINAQLDNGLAWNKKLRMWEGHEGLLYDVFIGIQRMSCEEQKFVIDELTQRYAEQMEYLDQSGINDLKTSTLKLDASTIDEAVFVKGKDSDSGNYFAQDTNIERVEANVLKKPLKSADILKKMKQLGVFGEDDKINDEYGTKKIYDSVKDACVKVIEDFQAKQAEALKKFMESMPARLKLNTTTMTPEEIEEKIVSSPLYTQFTEKQAADLSKKDSELSEMRSNVYNALMYLKPGMPYFVPLTDNVGNDAPMMYGRFIGFETGDYKPRSIKALFAVKDSRSQISIPVVSQKRAIDKIIDDSRYEMLFNELMEDKNPNFWERRTLTSDEKLANVDEWWDKMIPKGETNRQIRYMITGNVLQACGAIGKYKGQIVSYTRLDKETGETTIDKGMLLAEDFDPENFRIKKKVSKEDVWSNYSEHKDKDHNISVHRSGDYLVVKFLKSGKKLSEHPVNKDEELLKLFDAFNPYKDRLEAWVKEENAEEVLEQLYSKYSFTSEELFVMPDSTEKPDAIVRTDLPYSDVIDKYSDKYSCYGEYDCRSKLKKMLKQYKMDINNEDLKNQIKEVSQLYQAYLREKFTKEESVHLAWQAIIYDEQAKEALAEDDKEARERYTRIKEAVIEELEYRKFGGHEMHLKQGEWDRNEFVDTFNKLNSNEENAKRFDKIWDIVSKLNMNIILSEKIQNSTGGQAAGKVVEYNWKYMNAKYISDQAKADTILHELTHTVTSYAVWCVKHGEEHLLPADMLEDVNYLKSILGIIKNDEAFKHDSADGKYTDYGVTNEHEILAEISSNDAFRKDLKKVDLVMGTRFGKTTFYPYNPQNASMTGATKVNAYDVVMEILDRMIGSFNEKAWEEFYKGSQYGGYAYSRFEDEMRKEGKGEQAIKDAENPKAITPLPGEPLSLFSKRIKDAFKAGEKLVKAHLDTAKEWMKANHVENAEIKGGIMDFLFDRFGEGNANLWFETPESAKRSKGQYQLVGEVGAKNYTPAQTALNRAKQMEAEGKTPAEIRKETLCERGVDGKWRLEVPDVHTALDSLPFSSVKEASKYNGKDKLFRTFADALSITDATNFDRDVCSLGDILSGEEASVLLQMYPELAKINVVTRNLGKNTPTALSADAKTLYIWTPKNLRSNIIHEIQHAIQVYEGFDRGAHISNFREHSDSRRGDELYNRLWNIQRDANGDTQIANLRFDELANEEGFSTRGELVKFVEDNSNYYKYLRVKGEVEARNVQRRMDKSDKWRKENLLVNTEDVKRRLQIDSPFGGQLYGSTIDQADPIYSGNFKRWFGDWENDPENASKVVDENGNPLVVYHGTKDNFTVFNYSKFGVTDGGNSGKGFYFTPSKQNADSYAGKSGNTMEVYLDIKNPYVDKSWGENPIADSAVFGRTLEETKQMLENQIEVYKKEGASEEELAGMRKMVDDYLVHIEPLVDEINSHDGVISYRNNGEVFEYVVRDSSQVKSATNNNGDYDPNNKDINFHLADGTVYGWANSTGIHLTIDGIRPETMIHEYGHLWLAGMKDSNPALYESLMRLAKDTPAWNDVVNDPNYSDLETDDEILSEVFSRFSGTEGEKKLVEVTREAMTNGVDLKDKARLAAEYSRFAKKMDRAWGWTAKTLLGQDIEQFSSMAEAADMLLMDLVSTDNDGGYTPSGKLKTPKNGNPYFVNKNQYSKGGNASAPSDVASSNYERIVSKLGSRVEEAWVDYLSSVRTLQESIVKETGNEVHDYENAYLHMMHLSSVNKAEQDKVQQTLVEPLTDAMNDILTPIIQSYINSGMKKKDARERAMSDLEMYMIGKHGLERNKVLARRDAKAKAEKEYAERMNKAEAEYNKAQKDFAAGLINQSELDAFEQALTKLKAERLVRENNLYNANRKIDYSGFTETFGDPSISRTNTELEQMAKTYADGFEARVGKTSADALWNKINALNAYTLEKSLKSGNMSKESYDAVSTQYQHYVPLRGWDATTAEDVYHYMSEGRDKIQPTLKTARGRKSRAGDILATMLAMNSSAIIQGNKNVAKQKLLNLVQNNKTSLTSVSHTWYVQDANGDWNPSYPVNGSGEPLTDPQDIADWENDMKELKKQGLARVGHEHFELDKPIKRWEEDEHQIRVNRNGKEFVIYVNGAPNAAQAINGQLNMDADKSSALEVVTRPLGQLMARAYTAWNPLFLVRNLQKDAISSAMVGEIKFGKEYVAKFSANLAKIMPGVAFATKATYNQTEAEDIVKRGSLGVYSLIRKYNQGELDMNNEVEKYFQEFMENGAHTGYSMLWNVEEYGKKLDKAIKKANSKIIAQKADGVREAFLLSVEEINASFEDISRFATYMTSRQSGRSILMSVADAKDASTNFNKKGSGAMGNRLARDLYIFMNPAIQGVSRYIYRLADKDISGKGKDSAIKDKQTARAIAGFTSLVGIGAAISALNYLVGIYFGGGDDDDEVFGNAGLGNEYWKLSTFKRRNTINLPGQMLGKGYFAINLTPEEAVPYGIGAIIAEHTLGYGHPDQIAPEVISQVSRLNPFGDITPQEWQTLGDAGNQVWRNILPSAFLPVWEIYDNRNFMGDQIHGYDNAVKKGTPKNQVAIHNAIDSATNGRLGAFGNINNINHFLNGYFGGLVEFPTMLVNTMEGMLSEEGVNLNETPAKVFWNTTANKWNETSAMRSEYEYYKNRVDYLEKRMKAQGITKQGEQERYVKEHLEDGNDYKYWNAFQKYAKDMNSRKGNIDKDEVMKKAIRDWRKIDE